VLPDCRRQIVKEGVQIEAGRTHTVMIANVAVLQVNVKGTRLVTIPVSA